MRNSHIIRPVTIGCLKLFECRELEIEVIEHCTLNYVARKYCAWFGFWEALN